MSEAARWDSLRSEGSAADGQIYVEMDMQGLSTVQISRNLLQPEHQRRLEKAIQEAVNQAMERQFQAGVELTEEMQRENAPASPEQLDRIETLLQEIRDRRAW